jgi:Cytochrome P450
MGTFCMVLALYPDVVKRAQAEVDSVTGGERLPTFDDQDSLPYIDALFWETLRYNTVTPLGMWQFPFLVLFSWTATGLPHRVVSDDFYQGMHIPGGTTIVGNMWYAPSLPCFRQKLSFPKVHLPRPGSIP